MEDKKKFEDDVVEEHNGVYGGKWHIVSTEGFDLPEGHSYLKNSREGNWESFAYGRPKRILKYYANIKVNNIPLGDALKGWLLFFANLERMKQIWK